MKPLPKPSEWQRTNPTYEKQPPRRFRQKVVLGDGLEHEVIEIDGGCWFDVVQHNAACTAKPK